MLTVLLGWFPAVSYQMKDFLSLFRGTPEKQIKRLRKKVKEPHGDPATRINAAHRLREMGTQEAILALLDRFTISASPSRQDEEEKEEVLTWLIGFGEQCVAPIVQFLKRERQVYWPVRALGEILPPEELSRRIDEVLTYHWENPPASSGPKAQLIQFLEGMHSPELEETVFRYLEDDDDDVCLAALDYVFRRPEEKARDAVLNCYLDSEDRPRIRTYILERFVENGWSVRGFRPRVEDTLPQGYILTRDSTIRVVGGRG